MQTLDATQELTVAIDYIEELLNGQNGEMVLEIIKKFKESKTLDVNDLLLLENPE